MHHALYTLNENDTVLLKYGARVKNNFEINYTHEFCALDFMEILCIFYGLLWWGFMSYALVFQGNI